MGTATGIAGLALIVFWMFVGETKDLKVDKKDRRSDGKFAAQPG